MTLDEDFSAAGAGAAETRRRVFSVQTPDGPGQIAAVEFGPPDRPVDVVFLHANGFNALTYRSALAPLASRLRILAIDQEGHGRSIARRPNDRRTDWHGFRDDLIAVVDQLGPAPVLLGGHSMGGAVCVLTAAERPGRVKALALFDPVVMPQAVARKAAADGPRAFSDSPLVVGALRRRAVFPSRAEAIENYRGRGAFRTWPDEALNDYVGDGFRDRADGQVELACAPAWEAGNFASHAHDTAGALHRLRTPVAILRAEAGSTCSVQTASAFKDANPAFEVETIAETTHFLPIERPELTRGLIARMVQSA